MSFILSPLKILGEYIFGEWDSASIARGIAFGTLCGLVPKWNLTSFLLVLSLLVFRLNLICGLIAMAATTLLAGLFDPVAARIGLTILEIPVIDSIGEWLISLPVMPWTTLDNSVVLGQLIIGLLLYLPIYGITKSILGDKKNESKIPEKPKTVDNG